METTPKSAFVEVFEPVLLEGIVASYDGEVTESGCFVGMGSAVLDSGVTYEGTFVNGTMHGDGKMVWPDGTVYQGMFAEGLISGQGKYQWPDESTYAGAVKNGKRDGFGLFKCSAGQIYEGHWVAGKREGHGTMSYFEKTSTVVYTGAWFNGLREGYGKMTYASGNCYEGEWYRDKKHGSGAMTWRKGEDVYIGQWQDDNQYGYGEFIWGDATSGSNDVSSSSSKQTNNIYRGHWKNGLREGEGTFFYGDGSQYTGAWEANAKHGLGVMIYPDGNVVAGTFHLDKLGIFVRYNDVNGKPVAKMADDANLQFRVLFDDVFMKLATLDGPLSGPPSDTSTAAMAANSRVSSPVFLKQTQELERLILRFTSYLKIIFKRLSDGSNHRRNTSSINDVVSTDPYVAAWSTVERTQALARVLHRRFFCLTISDVQRFLLELNILHVHFTSADLFDCLQQMKSHHKFVVQATVGKFHVAYASSVGAPSSGSNKNYWCDLVDDFLGPKNMQPNQSMDPRQPLREREFIELLIRCVVQADFKKRVCLSSLGKSVKSQSLQNTITEFFSRCIYPSATSSNSSEAYSPFVVAFQSPLVRATLGSGGESTLRALFNRATGFPDKTVQLKHALVLLKSLSVFSSADMAKLLDSSRSVEVSEKTGDEHLDLDCARLNSTIDFADFLFLLCKALLSDSFISPNPPSAAEAEVTVEDNDVAVAREGEGSDEQKAGDALSPEELLEPPPSLDAVLNTRLVDLISIIQ